MPIEVTLITPPADTTEIAPTLADAAAQPKSMTSDGQTVTTHSLSERIEYERFKATQAAAANRKLGGIRRVKMNPPGAV